MRKYMITWESVTMLETPQEMNWNGKVNRCIYFSFHTGKKREKFYITIAFACNADRNKCLPPIYIGKSKLPRCFKKYTSDQLELYYWNNKKAWMTSELFEE